EDLKTKFLSKYCPPARTAKKIEEINNFQHEPDETLYQAWERSKELLMKCLQHYLTDMQEPSKIWLNILKNGTTEHLEQEVMKLLMDWVQFKHDSIILEDKSKRATRNDDSLPQKKKDPGSFTLLCYINNVCFENALADLGASVSVMPLSTYLNLGIGKFVFPIDFIILDTLKDVKVPLILERPFLSTTHAKIDVFKRKITLRVWDEKIIFKSVKPDSSLIKRVYMLSLREHIELDLEARLMGETLVLNRSLYPLYEDYIELNYLNVPLELRRDRLDDLMPTIKEGEVVDNNMIEEVKTRDDNKKVSKIFGYPNKYEKDEKICIDCAYNSKFSCMIGFELLHANFFPNLPINVMSKKFYNSIIKDKIEFRWRNELGNFTNVLVFIGNFYVITYFIVVEDMDPYLDDGIGEVVIGEPFYEVSCMESRRFDGIITIHNEDDSVTYQIVRDNPRFKHLTNEQ
nr:hypothetical protein [Tanacetum cinerariifolium]